MPYLSQHVVAVSTHCTRLSEGLILVRLGDCAAADWHYVVDDAVGIKDNVVNTFPTLVEIGVDGCVCSEIPLTLVGIGIVDVAVDHVELPLEIHVEVAPSLGGIESHCGRLKSSRGCIVGLQYGFVDGVDCQEIVAGYERSADNQRQD